MSNIVNFMSNIVNFMSNIVNFMSNIVNFCQLLANFVNFMSTFVNSMSTLVNLCQLYVNFLSTFVNFISSLSPLLIVKRSLTKMRSVEIPISHWVLRFAAYVGYSLNFSLKLTRFLEIFHDFPRWSSISKTAFFQIPNSPFHLPKIVILKPIFEIQI